MGTRSFFSIFFSSAGLELPIPWYWSNGKLEKQLAREINEGHVLFNHVVKEIARKQDNDDVLFKLDDGKYAVVHLTWTSEKLSLDHFPTTKIYKDWEDVYQDRILPDKKFFEAHDENGKEIK